MRGLLEAGVDIDLFAIYPLEPELWRYVPNILTQKHLPPEKMHHTSIARTLRAAKPWPLAQFGAFLPDAAAISAAALKFGAGPLAKTAYTLLEAWAWARENRA
jgi:glycosyltransferase involved in cell wall biosynthesis